MGQKGFGTPDGGGLADRRFVQRRWAPFDGEDRHGGGGGARLASDGRSRAEDAASIVGSWGRSGEPDDILWDPINASLARSATLLGDLARNGVAGLATIEAQGDRLDRMIADNRRVLNTFLGSHD